LRLFREVPAPQKGELAVPERPGLGLEFDEAALRRYGVNA
jgi:L-alanine-DL-glutamate epimerase-like enolase superfamily enzyme